MSGVFSAELHNLQGQRRPRYLASIGSGQLPAELLAATRIISGGVRHPTPDHVRQDGV